VTFEQRLVEIARRHAELESQLADPAVLADRARYTEVARAHAELAPTVRVLGELRQFQDQLESAKELLKDASPADATYLRGEVTEAERQIPLLTERLRELLLTKDPNDQKDVIVEIRAAVGGEEAALFAGDLFQMYTRYAESKGWRTEKISASESDQRGGYKEIVFAVKGKGAWSRLKYEAGSHRVQRVPSTESQGRLHTSVATVAVLPEAEDVDVDIDESDLVIDVYRSTGPGGQSVNTTDSAVRITHVPSGLVVAMQDEKSQLQNRVKAMRVLRARLLQAAIEAQHAEISASRRAQVGSGERAEKIRTYNFPQNRVTDHRISMSVHDLESVLQGALDGFIDALAANDRMRQLAGQPA
jgi:peptide chain release factor 1